MGVHAQFRTGNRLHVHSPMKPRRVDHPLDARGTRTTDFELDVTDVAALGARHRRKQRRGKGEPTARGLRLGFRRCGLPLRGLSGFGKRLGRTSRHARAGRWLSSGCLLPCGAFRHDVLVIAASLLRRAAIIRGIPSTLDTPVKSPVPVIHS